MEDHGGAPLVSHGAQHLGCFCHHGEAVAGSPCWLIIGRSGLHDENPEDVTIRLRTPNNLSETAPIFNLDLLQTPERIDKTKMLLSRATPALRASSRQFVRPRPCSLADYQARFNSTQAGAGAGAPKKEPSSAYHA